MKAFEKTEGIVAPLDRVNVDTDQIIPKQFLKSVKRTGFGDNLFDGWRYMDEGEVGVTPNERRVNHEFVLNRPRFQDAKILLARRNFGCGSSREHAVWALMEFGFEVVIAPSFADIFFNNCFKNGLLPIVLNEEIVGELFEAVEAEENFALRVDLAAQTVATPSGQVFGFDMDGLARDKLLRGLDDIGLTLDAVDRIRAFEQEYFERRAWLGTARERVVLDELDEGV
ncbi:MAG: 3-isopropylmalate dehydratase small subunit [Pseudomonadales bacterium]|jgi:3-isopropylmalate/(R)-2-methylmalate dehydratase small subunit|nr:3-isopropylmalate dehydratase small subunit [Pseudomonadales bacterium]MDP6473151.1 3-isopropylmalate dehydratase small subunit [Pseudomonadales bacterium]MDP6826092.1 3-isopropylmalate dehydratase small subunit [Pseudomonadales bacterium]MDP6970375.1 3-isopropylmalate dehydratase small subunit [Pseudomonadales bacterium]|tara:strand:- start:64 stop:744 length:681 start_codon:yes stop_codon:yes gene_type:complete